MTQKTITIQIRICDFEDLSTSQRTLITKAKEQTSKAYAPYSNFHVGAAVELENGEIYCGNNQENAAYPSGLCAERVALFYANAQQPDIPVNAIAIAAYSNGKFTDEPITPCGACRQVMLESENRFNQNIILLLYGTSKIYIIEKVKDLLPLSFEGDSLKQ